MAFFPPIVLVFPVYELVRAAGLVNRPWGLIIPYAALNLPFAPCGRCNRLCIPPAHHASASRCRTQSILLLPNPDTALR